MVKIYCLNMMVIFILPLEENDTITVKAYKDDGTLIEEISVDKNQK